MEIDITDFVKNEDPFEFSASQAERGRNAGPETWANANDQAKRTPLLTTPAHFKALRSWAEESGAWDEDERNAWSNDECNALFIQLVSGDIREAEMDQCDIEDFDWDAYEIRCESYGGNIFRGDDGRIWYELS